MGKVQFLLVGAVKIIAAWRNQLKCSSFCFEEVPVSSYCRLYIFTLSTTFGRNDDDRGGRADYNTCAAEINNNIED